MIKLTEEERTCLTCRRCELKDSYFSDKIVDMFWWCNIHKAVVETSNKCDKYFTNWGHFRLELIKEKREEETAKSKDSCNFR